MISTLKNWSDCLQSRAKIKALEIEIERLKNRNLYEVLKAWATTTPDELNYWHEKCDKLESRLAAAEKVIEAAREFTEDAVVGFQGSKYINGSNVDDILKAIESYDKEKQ